MRLSNLLPLLALLPLSACLTSKDQLLHSRSSLTLPVGSIHVPPRDSGIVLQGNFAISASPGGSSRVEMSQRELFGSRSTDRVSEALGSSNLSTSPIQAAGEASLFLSEHLRLGGGFDVSSQGAAPWAGLGVRFGKQVSVETFAALGLVPVSSEAVWNVQTYRQEGTGFASAPDTTIVLDSLVERAGSSRQEFWRIGVHVAARDGGPFVEVQTLGLELLQPSPSAGDRWGTTMTLLGAGWSQPTAYGTGTAYVRGLYTGKTVIPSLGVQWTGELKLGR